MSARGTRRPSARASARERNLDPSAGTNARPGGAGGLHGAIVNARSTDIRLAVTLTVAELRELVRDVVLGAVADIVAPAPPALLDRTGVARALGVGTSSVDRFRSEGMPVVWIGDVPRFELDPCLDWLRQRRRPVQK